MPTIMKELMPYILLALIALTILGFLPARESYDDRAIKAIVGEYAVQDEYGMQLFAHAIRNRGTLRGVYGEHAKHIYSEPKIIWALARLSWQESAHEADISFGANEWRSMADIDKHGIPTDAFFIGSYKDTFFFKTNKPTRR